MTQSPRKTLVKLSVGLALFSVASAVGLQCPDAIAYARQSGSIQRVKLDSLYPLDKIDRPGGSGVFYDPADTYTFAFATLDIVDEQSRVLELGSGMGLASWLISSKAKRVHGVDISDASVKFSKEKYSSPRVSFSVHDYLLNGPRDLIGHWPVKDEIPNVLAANPPYVPCDSRETCRQLPDSAWASMYGGPHGTRYHFEIINYADALGIEKLALCLGSYSTPIAVHDHLDKFGYRVTAVTLTAVRNGRFSDLNRERIEALRNAGQAYTWQSAAGEGGYIIVGLSAMRKNVQPGAKTFSREQLTRILSLASASGTNRLELLTEQSVGPMPIRIVME